MNRGSDYEWNQIQIGNSKSFECGHCGHPVSSNQVYVGWRRNGGAQLPWQIYICHHCGKPNFFDTDDSQSPILNNVKESFPPHIETISPEFVETYNQALSAEKIGLDKIAGPGFRRALEFLVKDFLISQIPSTEPDVAGKAQIIKDKQLGPCITDHLDNEKIKTTARGAAYIGNDETHYTKKWPTKDIQDLKKFISLTVHWIEAELSTAEMQKEMGL